MQEGCTVDTIFNVYHYFHNSCFLNITIYDVISPDAGGAPHQHITPGDATPLYEIT